MEDTMKKNSPYDLARELIFEYEAILTGQHKIFSLYYFRFGDETNEAEALRVFKYAFDTYLRWTPEELYRNLTVEMLETLKLTQLLRFVKYPPEADASVDVYPIVAKLYPGRFKENMRDSVMRVYDRVISDPQGKFPKEYFIDNEGRVRALLCLQYALNKMPPFKSVQDMYESFVGPPGTALLKRMKLYSACSRMFEFPIDYLHEALPKTVKSEYWYHFYRFSIISKRRDQRYYRQETSK